MGISQSQFGELEYTRMDFYFDTSANARKSWDPDTKRNKMKESLCENITKDVSVNKFSEQIKNYLHAWQLGCIFVQCEQ